MNVAGDGSTAHVSYELQKKYATFESSAAINDAADFRGTGGSQTPLTFKILGDGKTLWRSTQGLQKAGSSERCMADVKGVEKLELIVECPGPCMYAQGVWVEPRVTPLATQPKQEAR